MGEDAANEHDEERLEHIITLTQLMQDIDVNRSGTVSAQEIRDHREILSYIRKMELPVGLTMDELFLMLSPDGNDEVNIHDFVLGLCRIVKGDLFHSMGM